MVRVGGGARCARYSIRTRSRMSLLYQNETHEGDVRSLHIDKCGATKWTMEWTIEFLVGKEEEGFIQFRSCHATHVLAKGESGEPVPCQSACRVSASESFVDSSQTRARGAEDESKSNRHK